MSKLFRCFMLWLFADDPQTEAYRKEMAKVIGLCKRP